MAEVNVVPATADRFDDVTRVLNPNERPEACWCLHWRQPSGLGVAARGEHLHRLCDQDPRPGLLGYLDEGEGETVVGWVGLAPRSAATSLHRSRKLPRGDPDTWATTWVAMCFVVRAGYRRRGVARALLRAGVAYAGAHGARAVEGFPVDPEPGRRVPVSAAFVGTVPLFESEGFERVTETASTSGRLPRWLVRLELDAS